MRMSGVRVYTRPTPVPKMPPGLVELIEGLSKEVLRHNPSDVYDFCARHMQNLLDIRDGPITKDIQYLSLDQKIANAQEKVRQRAEKRRFEYDNDTESQRGKEIDQDLVPDDKNPDVFEPVPLIKFIPKGPVHHELGLADASEIEISHEPASSPLGNEVAEYNEQNDVYKEKETINEDEKGINENDKITMCNVQNKNDEVLGNVQEKNTDFDEIIINNELVAESKVTQENTLRVDADVKNVHSNSDNKLPQKAEEGTQKHVESSEIVSESHDQYDVIEETVQKDTLNDATNSELSKEEERNDVKSNEGTDIKQNNSKPLHEQIELQQQEDTLEFALLPELNIVSDFTKQIEPVKNVALDSNTADADTNIILKEQDVERKSDVVEIKQPVEEVNNDSEVKNISVNTKAVVESQDDNPSMTIIYDANTKESKDITENSKSPIEVIDTPENKLIDSVSASSPIDIFASVAGDNSEVQVDVKTDNQTTPERHVPVDKNLKNIDDSISADKETINVENIHKVLDTNSKGHEDELNVKISKCNITEDTPQVNDIIQKDFHEPSNMDLETAAITIQKVFRTFLFKSRASTFGDSVNDEGNSIDEDNENKDQCDYTITSPLKDRRALGITRMDTVLQTVNEEKSLSLSTDDSSTLSSAATIIQAHVRGYLVRNKLNSNKTASSNSMLNSDGPFSTSLDNDPNPQKKTVLNIHIVPEGGNLSRDESLITYMDLSLDGSPPSSSNLHPLGYDKSERRKQLKREDAFQSISPPSNNSGKLSEDVDSVIEQCVTDNYSEHKRDSTEKTGVEFCGTTLVENTNIESVSNDHNTATETRESSHGESEIILNNKRKSLSKMSSDEMDVVTPFGESEHTIIGSNSENTPNLLHSGEMHDIVLPTKVSRSDTSVVRGE